MRMRIRIAVILLLAFAAAMLMLGFGREPKNVFGDSGLDQLTNKTPGATSENHRTATATDSELGKAIDQAIDESQFSSARWGVFVMSLRDGRVLYSRDAEKLFTPASNMKIFTTAVALDLLGADFRWRTSVYAAAEPDAGGTIIGDLTLYGRGAPDLVSQSQDNQSSLVQLADALYARGVRRVKGNVVGDESYFRGNQFGDGWLWNDVQWYFGAEASALSIHGNEISLSVAPASRAGIGATVTVNRSPDFFHVVNNVATRESSIKSRVGINRGRTDNEFVVWGEFPAGGKGFSARLSVPHPALWAASLLRDALVARGIVVDGQPVQRDFRAAEQFDPQKALELAAVTSQSLADIVIETNKRSINLNAELILRTLGKERGVLVPVKDTQARERGDDEAGLAVIRLWLERSGISSSRLALHDGSGLSRLDLVTAESAARLLAATAKTSIFSTFRNSLPIAGKDGTLGSRMAPTEGRIVAKTGSLTYDDALSGYATTSDGETLAFSIICNDATGRGHSSSVIDQIGQALADYPFSNRRKLLKK